MKRYGIAALVSLILFGFTAPCWSYTIKNGAVDVGDKDVFLRADGLSNSGDLSEVEWINGALTTAFSEDDLTKYDSMTWWETNESGIFAIDLQTINPEYFFIKTGNLKVNENEHFLYNNVSNLGWGVIDLRDLGLPEKQLSNISKISHTGELGTRSIPEPGTLVLVGLGLLGLTGIRRKIK